MKNLAHAVEDYREYKLGLHPDTTVTLGDPNGWLNRAVGPQPLGSLIVVGGHTNTGKTFFSLTLATEASQPAAILSLEDSSRRIGRRSAGLPESVLRRTLLVCPTRKTTRVVEASMIAAHTAGARLLVIDYAQLIRCDHEGTSWSRTDEIARVVSTIKSVAMELGVVVVLNSQLRRPERGNEDRRPSVWDLGESKSLEDSADVVVLLHKHPTVKGMTAFVAKSKDSDTGAAQFYSRDPNTGWLIPGIDPELGTDDEESF